MSEQILIVEDEAKIARVVAEYLQRDGFQTEHLDSGTNAVERIRTMEPTLVILDLNLPGKDGVTICRETRAFSRVPILMLTARVDEIDRLLGLEIGADDYVCKPFSPREVVARVKAILRRVAETPPSEEPPSVLTNANVTLDSESHECAVNGALLDLTPVEFRILQALLARPGKVFSRDHLMAVSYPDERVVSDRTVDSHVKNLRRKLTGGGADPELIRAVYGVGYRLD